ncbi:MAG TPA: TIGR00282 family metallophosphoesterase [Armatimonadota bacterium]|nr:TIGR00282 family metallophosphoesterase [Armatimonadota bacterium]
MRVLAVGDVVGSAGRKAIQQLARDLKRAHQADFLVVNCENAAAGFGITPETADELFEAGADCLTSGNHIWKHRTIYAYIEEEPRLLRPANYPEGTPGRGWGVYRWSGGEVVVVNLMGRAGLEPLDCPFRAFDEIYREASAASPFVLVDFHAESTSEKGAFARYVDGRASLVWGTHTHVQTADERVLPGGTGFITDLGMTGPEESVIGVAKENIIERFLTRMPQRFEVPSGPALLCGIVADLDPATGTAVSVRRIQERSA